MPEMRNFVVVYLAALVIALGGVATFNYLVDPYAVFGSKPLASMAGHKVAAIDQPDLAKTYLLERSGARTILLGNSRVDLGLDPESEAWPAEWRPVFNLAVPGFYMNERVQHFEHALAAGDPGILVYGLSIDDFWPFTPVPATDPEAVRINSRLRVAPDGTMNPLDFTGRATDYAFALLSFRAAMDSVRTLRSQDDDEASAITSSGFNTGGSNNAQAARDGYRAVADWKIRDKLPRLRAWARERKLDFAMFDRLVEDVRSHKVKTVIFIAPSYVDEYVLYRELGLEEDYASWKRQLTQRIEAAQASGVDIALWDFSGANEESTEPMPAPGDRTTSLKWFWEAQHFKPRLGEKIIRAITAGGDDYGTRLTAETIEDHLIQWRADLDRYAAERSADIGRVRAVMESFTHEMETEQSAVSATLVNAPR